VHAKVTNISITNSTLPTAGEALKLNGSTASADGELIVCWDVGGAGAQNTITGDWATGGSQASLYLHQRFPQDPGSIRLPGCVPAGAADANDAAVTTYLNGRNSITPGPSAGQVTVLVDHLTGGAGGTTTPFAGGVCTTP